MHLSVARVIACFILASSVFVRMPQFEDTHSAWWVDGHFQERRREITFRPSYLSSASLPPGHPARAPRAARLLLGPGLRSLTCERGQRS